MELAQNEDQLHYPVLYAIGREGKSWKDIPSNPGDDADLTPVFEAIIESIPKPQVAEGDGDQLLVTALDWDSFKGKYAIGRITRGSFRKTQAVAVVDSSNQPVPGKIDGLYSYKGLARTEIDSAEAGDIVAITGLDSVKIGQTITDVEHPEALPEIELEPPTLSIYLGPNTSPVKGTEGKFTTSRQISGRLDQELETNIGLEVEPDGIGFVVRGRGELHLSVLIETMRREGYEFEVGRPQVVTTESGGKTLEPFEEVTVEVPTEYTGAVQAEFGKRQASLQSQHQQDDGSTQLIYEMPTRALLGTRSLLVAATKGTIIISSIMSGYKDLSGAIDQHRNGALVAWEAGSATAYSLQNAESRGIVFVSPGTKVYGGQIVGLNSRGGDMDINVAKEKHLTNMRSTSSDGTVQLTPATVFSLEQSIDFLEDDELLEVTPKSLRLRKRELDRSKRKKK